MEPVQCKQTAWFEIGVVAHVIPIDEEGNEQNLTDLIVENNLGEYCDGGRKYANFCQ